MKINNLPCVSIVIPTLNEEKNIETCLNAIISQSYPQSKLDLIIVDNYSEDKTTILAKKYPVRIIFNKIKNAQVSKMIGFRKAKGQFFLYIDSDIEIVGRNWIKNLVNPLIQNDHLVGSFGRFIPKSTDSPIGRYLREHPLELDPVLQFFCTPIEKTIVSEDKYFKICNFTFPKIPPVGICLYRTKSLNLVLKGKQLFMDVDTPALLSKSGFRYFAYVPSCGFYHINYKSLFDIPKRKRRNININFLPNYNSRDFQYFDIYNPLHKFKIVYWIMYANLFIPSLIKGIINAIKKKKFVMLYEPFAALIITDGIIIDFLRNKLSKKIIRDYFSFNRRD